VHYLRQYGVVFVVVALLLLAAPFAVWPHYGEDQYYLYAAEGADLPANEEAVDYADLPPEARAAFLGVRDGSRAGPFYERTDGAVVESFEGVTYVDYEDTTYEVALDRRQAGWAAIGAIRGVLWALGGVLGAAGVHLFRRDPDSTGTAG